MSERPKPSREIDETDMLADGEFDLEDFVDSMESETARRAEQRKRKRAGWQRVDDWRDARWLRDQLNDWDDWKEEPDET
jgi:hypothetical protein